jgi:hypothetical protein
MHVIAHAYLTMMARYLNVELRCIMHSVLSRRALFFASGRRQASVTGDDIASYPLMNCTSNAIVTSSPTSTPPDSRAEFQVSPNSLRLIFAEAERPMR